MRGVSGTRQQRAIELLRRIEEFDPVKPWINLTPEQADEIRKNYQRWQRSWVRSQIIELVRELAPVHEAIRGHELGFEKLDDILDATRKHLKQKEKQNARRNDG